ncbi:MAG: efflux RND transporter periplasmic adaptor subunit [Vicinamibacteria bacterium]|nr:efflux RND transporter periplasmic adaptor subunit [Vicinamibacteria bacterium]
MTGRLTSLARRGRVATSVILESALRITRRAAARARAHPRLAFIVLAAAVMPALIAAWLLLPSVDRDLTTLVRRGDLKIRLIETGVLRPARSITYRAPLAGRELEITHLVPEGTRVREGDLLVRLDTTDIENEKRRIVQDLRQAQLDLRGARIQRQEATAALESLIDGEGSLSLDELRAQLQLAERKVDRLTSEHESLKPLLEKGFITRDELERAAYELEQAQAELNLSRKKTRVYLERTYPRERERAQLELAQRAALEDVLEPRLEEARARAETLEQAIAGCEILAERPGLVVYEVLLSAHPRRKIRAGDRVTRSQGLITIPEVGRMIVESSVDEASLHKVRAGQSAVIRLDAYPDLTLDGKVSRVGTLARASADRPFEEKRFDLVVDVVTTRAELRPEMSARIDVLAGERRNVLLLPVNAVFEREGMLVAYVVKTFGIEARQVEAGESNEIDVEIVAGLREGERVTLLPPPESVAGGPAAAREGQDGATAPLAIR